MSKKKEPKVARIRYVEPTGEKNCAENGCFVFEAWLEENAFQPKGWGHIMTCPCTKSVQWPDAPDFDFIHWEILKKIAEWSRIGYTICYGTRETAYLDEIEKEELEKWEEKKAKSSS